ncbi:polynucleotide adenylyltransferase family protein [Citrus sinensis]|uniref:Polynucleotide adenylyltransferase family protein n=1 Tax=Citrus sinensis TaxID=2711 RepID=A0ACB8LAH6_CITSI|nr:polynucleotide adenylyltransferase family protein [Citrus sinensis]
MISSTWFPLIKIASETSFDNPRSPPSYTRCNFLSAMARPRSSTTNELLDLLQAYKSEPDPKTLALEWSTNAGNPSPRYEVYLVGGCVRDLMLNRIPKDFDIITSAELKEVVRVFSQCEIVGKRFPICHVHFENTIVEVQTVIPASTSFQEDCARILRAIRIAARLGFRFSRETAHFVKHLSPSILKLDRGRLLMEMNYMLAYGSAEASLRLLWKFGLLEVLLPIQAAYLVKHGFRRRDKRSNLLLSLFSNLDKLLAPDRPCHSSLWIAILAFHKALSDQPRDPLVVAVFSLAVYNGGDMLEAVKIARRINKSHDESFCELLEPRDLDFEALKHEVMDFAESSKGALSKMTDEYFVSQAMAGYSRAPFSDLVFIPLALYLKASKIFECVRGGGERRFASKQGSKIDYESLAYGSPQEVRHTFARIVFDTVYPLDLTE